MGVVFPVQYICGTIDPITAGITYDVTGDYNIIFGIGVTFAIISIVGIAIAVLPKSNIGELKEYRETL